MTERDKQTEKAVYEQIVDTLENQGVVYVSTYYLVDKPNPREGTVVERAVIIVASPREDLLEGFFARTGNQTEP